MNCLLPLPIFHRHWPSFLYIFKITFMVWKLMSNKVIRRNLGKHGMGVWDTCNHISQKWLRTFWSILFYNLLHIYQYNNFNTFILYMLLCNTLCKGTDFWSMLLNRYKKIKTWWASWLYCVGFGLLLLWWTFLSTYVSSQSFSQEKKFKAKLWCQWQWTVSDLCQDTMPNFPNRVPSQCSQNRC